MPLPCSPGVVPNDSLSFDFAVEASVGIDEKSIFSYGLSPNPLEEPSKFIYPHLSRMISPI